METTMTVVEEALDFFDTMLSPSNELPGTLSACMLPVVGLIVLYKKDPRCGIPIARLGFL